MTRETRIALIVGLAFIVLFGLVLGRRSLKLSAGRVADARAAGTSLPADRPGPEVVAASREDGGRRRPARPGEPARRRQGPSGPVNLAARQGRQREGLAAQGRQRPAQRRQDRPHGDRPGHQGPPGTSPPPASGAGSARTYTVQPGDTLIGIARRLYGRRQGRQYVRIFRANRRKLPNPSRLTVGQVLVIPPIGSDRAPSQPAAPPTRRHYAEMTLDGLARHFTSRRTYVVQAGDCLTEIARKLMGSGSSAAVQRLHEVNRDRIRDPDRLPVGLRLRVPDGA